MNIRAFAPDTPHVRYSRDWHAWHRALAVPLATSAKRPMAPGIHGYRRAGDWRRQDQSSVDGLPKGKRAASRVL
jgi:hypothetical protein